MLSISSVTSVFSSYELTNSQDDFQRWVQTFMVFGKKVIFHLHFYALLKPILNIILSFAAKVSFILVTKD